MEFLGFNITKKNEKVEPVNQSMPTETQLVSSSIDSLVVVMKQIVDQLKGINTARANESKDLASQIDALKTKKDFVDNEAFLAANTALSLAASIDAIKVPAPAPTTN